MFKGFILLLTFLFVKPCFSGEIITPTKVVEDFFNEIQTLDAKFVQIDSEKKSYNGSLLLKKVGKIRLEYSSGLPITVVVNDGVITYYDSKREQLSHVPAQKTIVSLLLKKVFLFTDPDIKIINQTQTDETISVEFEKTSMPEEGSFTLMFKRKDKNAEISKNNLEIAEIKIKSPKGEQTTLRMLSTTYNKAIDNSKFVLQEAKTQIDKKFKD